MLVGVNGSGKTTTVGKMAKRFKDEGKKVLLAACDTYRAAAQEQLAILAKRVGVEMVRAQTGADPAAVAYDSLEAAESRGADLLLIDTAGRLHTKVNLMEELKKIKRVLSKQLSPAPHEILLILDATVGQNALSQAKLFHEAIGLTGLVVAKLDGTAKGGIVLAITAELGLPVKMVGIGEGLGDLREFVPEEFTQALLQ